MPAIAADRVDPLVMEPVHDLGESAALLAISPDGEGEDAGTPTHGADMAGPPFPDGASSGTAMKARQPYGLSTLTQQTGKVGWEMAGILVATTATRFKDVTTGGSSFHSKDEGWFGKTTESLGMDKLHHAWKTYVVTDVLQSVIENRTGDRKGAAYTGAILGLGIFAYAEVLDGFTARTGFSKEDMLTHFAGAGLSLMRNQVPGMREKVDFRMQVNPSGLGKDLRLVDQLADRKYLLAFQLSGFRKLEKTPLRFVELHLGYYGRGFTDRERANGDPLRRKLYVGIGFNIQQLFARKPRSLAERLAKGTFDYIQLPYTSVHN